ncbi:uncharacterized protein [Atheta coriaria]|uniref:uncharacterized protein n=1 Tax=Dalotia coriaria TaxID=877792 RepID=UPI0031F34FC2
MVKQLFIIAAILAVTLGYPTNIQSEDLAIVLDSASGQQYYLVPIEEPQQESILVRSRRQTTSGGIDNKGFDISHTGKIFENNAHRVDGTGTLSKQFGGPFSTGGSVDYLHKRTNSGASVSATHTPGWGTDVGAQAKYNFFNSRDGRTTGSVSGNYDRHFGGPLGTGRPNYGAFLNFNHRF